MIAYSDNVVGGDTVTIKCDKCGFEQTAPKGDHNWQFSEAGWGLYSNAKKYKHKCWKCMPAKDRKAYEFVKEKFGSKHQKEG